MIDKCPACGNDYRGVDGTCCSTCGYYPSDEMTHVLQLKAMHQDNIRRAERGIYMAECIYEQLEKAQIKKFKEALNSD